MGLMPIIRLVATELWYIISFNSVGGHDYLRLAVGWKALDPNGLSNNLLHVDINYQISREQFETELGFELRTSGSLDRRSTT